MTTRDSYNKNADKGFDPTKWMSGFQKSARKNAKKKSGSTKNKTYAFGTPLNAQEQFIKYASGATPSGSPGVKYYVDPMTGSGRPALGQPTFGSGAMAVAAPATAPVAPSPRGIPSVPFQAGVGGNAVVPTTGQTSGGGEGDIPLDPWEGWAGESGFTLPGMDLIWKDPSLMSRTWLKEQGFNPDSGMMDLMARQASAMPLLAMLTLGTGGVNSNDPDDFLNMADQLMQGMMDPSGAGTLDTAQLIQNILDAPEGSALKALMEGGSFGEQADVFNDLIRVATMNKNPFMRQAIENAVASRTDDWMIQNAKGRKTPFLGDWFQRGGMGIFGP